MIREALSSVARNESIGGLISRAPGGRSIVRRVVGGDSVDEALEVAVGLADTGYWVSLERAAPHVDSDEAADRVLHEHLDLIDAVALRGLANVCEISVFPESLGVHDGVADGATRARMTELCDRAAARATTLMIGMGPAADVDVTLDWVEGLPTDLVGLTLQAALRRTEADCLRLRDRRVRLVKGLHRGGSALTHGQPIEVDKAFIRCAKALLRGTGEPSFATHDPRLVEIIETIASRSARDKQTYEFAFYMGRQEGLQERLCASGERVRVYVPYGPDWFERLVGGLAEQPSSITAAVRSLLPGA